MSMEQRIQVRDSDVFAVSDKGNQELRRGSNGLARAAIASLVLGLAGLSGAQAAADAERGRILYETRCSACHSGSVHKRSARKAKSYESVRAQVLRWSGEAGGSWSSDDIDDVTLYLNLRYYRFPCPSGACKANQASLAQ